MLVLVGSDDEAFVADAYETAVADYSDGEVQVIAAETHNSIYESEAAMIFYRKLARRDRASLSKVIWS